MTHPMLYEISATHIRLPQPLPYLGSSILAVAGSPARGALLLLPNEFDYQARIPRCTYLSNLTLEKLSRRKATTFLVKCTLDVKQCLNNDCHVASLISL
jgi:hypothetical protein